MVSNPPRGSNGEGEKSSAPLRPPSREIHSGGSPQILSLPSRSSKDLEGIVRSLLVLLGENPSREGLVSTPRRVAKALLELTAGYSENPSEILACDFAQRYDDLVLVRGVEFWSLCEHHLLPFHGTASVAYVPQGRVVGLSKLARLVHALSRRLQLQERLTEEIADAIEENLSPQGVAVHIEAEHLCMAMRGVRSSAFTITRAFRGVLKEGDLRREFLELVQKEDRTP